jgi:glyoxylase-like metal-dependent hydrolase (beta-lactamase superfamily II)
MSPAPATVRKPVPGRPQRVAPGLYWLPAGRGANVYIVQSGPWWVLVDTGWPGRAELIKAAAEGLLGAGARPVSILLTHLHPDHIGSAAELAGLWKVPVYVHPADLPLAAPRYPRQYWDPIGRVIEPLLRLAPPKGPQSTLEHLVQGLEPAGPPPGLADWQCVPAPGHTPGHAAFFRPQDRALITGDAVLTLNFNSLADLVRRKHRVSGPPYISTWNWAVAARSVAALAELQPQVLAPGHGRPMVGDSTAPALRLFSAEFSPRANRRANPRQA